MEKDRKLTLYFDDKKYKDNINIDLFLMGGRKHELSLLSSPKAELEDLSITSDYQVIYTDKKVLIDLTSEKEDKESYLLFKSSKLQFLNPSFKLHIFKPVDLKDLCGSYYVDSNKEQKVIITLDEIKINLADRIDSLPIFVGKNPHFDKLSTLITASFSSVEIEGINYAITPTIHYDGINKRIEIAVLLEAYSDIGSENYYSIGLGDEDAINSYSHLISCK